MGYNDTEENVDIFGRVGVYGSLTRSTLHHNYMGASKYVRDLVTFKHG